MPHHEIEDDDTLPALPWLWATMACAVGTLWVNWGWGRIAGKATGQELFVLMLVSLAAYPLALGLAIVLLIAVLKYSPGALRAAIILGLVALGLALFGAPTLWNLGFTAGIALYAWVHFQRAEQDDADLEKL